MVLKLRRGLEANLPTLKQGELAYATDTKALWIGTASGNYKVLCGCQFAQGV